MSVDLVIRDLAWSNWLSYELNFSWIHPGSPWRVVLAAPSAAQVAAIAPGASVILRVGGAIALNGTLWRMEAERSGEGTRWTLSGRDLSAALTDCTPPPGWGGRSLPLAVAAERALEDLGVQARVVAHADAQLPVRRLFSEPGETYWQVLDRYARQARLTLRMSAQGGLELRRAADADAEPVATLVHVPVGRAAQSNVLRARKITDWTRRYSDVVVLGQAGGADNLYGSAAKVSGSAADSDLVDASLFRPVRLDVGELRSSAHAQQRASWEVSQRKAESEVLEYSVLGHGPSTSSLWAPGQAVNVRDEVFDAHGTWWVSDVSFSRSREGGTLSTLALQRELPQAEVV